MERGEVEPATSTLARLHSTTELPRRTRGVYNGQRFPSSFLQKKENFFFAGPGGKALHRVRGCCTQQRLCCFSTCCVRIVRRVAPFSLFGACLLCLLLSACGGKSTRPDVVQPDVPEAVRVTPLETPGVFPVSEAEAQRLSRGLAPARQGMRSWKDMRFAVEQSLAYVRAKPSSRVAVNYPALQVTYGEMENASFP